SSNNKFDEYVEKATAEALPTGEEDIALSLEICDLIRSGTVPPKDAAKAIKQRILHNNPNVQLHALRLADVCVKNGGFNFIVEVVSPDFINELQRNILGSSPSQSKSNADVRDLFLELIHSWSIAFKGQYQLKNIQSLHDQIESSGYKFPESASVLSAFIDTSVAPAWVDSSTCMNCSTPFTLTNRKHHCRNCGNVFDQKCSSHAIPLPHYGFNVPVRVCDTCYHKFKKSKSTRKGSTATNNSSDIIEEDQDLLRAIELSLADSRPPPQRQQSQPEPQPELQAHASNEEEDDPDLKAAIEASLKEMNGKNPQSSPAVNLSNTQQQNASKASATYSHDLTQTEIENINLFAAIVDRLEQSPPGAILRNKEIQDLYESLSSLRPKLARSLAETIGKYDTLVENHAKLSTVVRYYDAMLERRFQ
ncbi:hypothetical protein CANCADRAFT_19913, partial [Tortispora caseinolytica NRRL Y-17796]